MFTESQKMHTCKKCKVAVMYVKCFFSKQACKANWDAKTHCAVPENIHTPPTEGIGISWVVRDSIRPKNVKKSMELNWNFQRGGGVLEKILSVEKVWIFSGITPYSMTATAFYTRRKSR